MEPLRPLSHAAGHSAERIARRRTGVLVALRRNAEVTVSGAGTTGRGAPPGARTLFEIGSITKVFTALLLADGVVRGAWELRTPVRELLPPGAEVPTRGGAEITLQHLATHTSGLVRSPAAIGLRENIAYLRHGSDPYAGFSSDDLLTALGSTRLRRTPGAGGVHYSNFGYGVLGHALAHASGADYGSAVARRICTPMGLADTAVQWRLTDEQCGRTALGHRSRRRLAAPWPLPGIPGAGALRSTAEDLMSFLGAQLSPRDSPLEAAIRLTQATPPGGPTGIGLGWHRADPETLWHNGGTGGFRTIAAFRPGTQTAVAVLVNQSAGADLRAFRLLKRLS